MLAGETTLAHAQPFYPQYVPSLVPRPCAFVAFSTKFPGNEYLGALSALRLHSFRLSKLVSLPYSDGGSEVVGGKSVLDLHLCSLSRG